MPWDIYEGDGVTCGLAVDCCGPSVLWQLLYLPGGCGGRRLRLLSFSSATCRLCLVVLVSFTPVPCSCSALLRCLRCNSLQSCLQRRRGNYVKEVTEITSSRLINPRYICASSVQHAGQANRSKFDLIRTAAASSVELLARIGKIKVQGWKHIM